jgi:UDP-N-acetylmuramate--alanine ligase
MELNQVKKVYFIGIGGIGMSAIARYFMGRGVEVHGYDRTETGLTQALAAEGMIIHYTDDVRYIPEHVDLVVYTPAVPKDMSELVYFQQKGLAVLKRAEVLGLISRGMRCIAVAGTHGKTTTSSLLTHILRVGGVDATAFLGGISLSIGSNFVAGKSEWLVVEADEYDRSFLHLSPDLAIINSMDADHLDIYGDEENFRQGFRDFANKVKPNGKIFLQNDLILSTGLLAERGSDDRTDIIWSAYGLGKGVYRAENLRVKNGYFVFDFFSPKGNIAHIQMALPGEHNVENATGAIAIAQELGIAADKIKEALSSFKGIKRRFDIGYRDEKRKCCYIDDYAHHPTELNAAITAARTLYPKSEIIGIFQPHLFTRTRDFLDGFAAALDRLDVCILLDIYPARELPIEGITSELLLNKMTSPHRYLTSLKHIMTLLNFGFKKGNLRNVTLMTLGAGDIDTLVEPIKEMLAKKLNS